MKRVAQITILVIAVSGVALLSASAVLAHFRSGNYISGDSQGKVETDPRNIVFYQNATWQNAKAHALHHDPRYGQHGSAPAWFKDHGAWDQADDYLTTGGWLDLVHVGELRDHIRFEQGDDPDQQWGTWTAAAIHHEVTSICLIWLPGCQFCDQHGICVPINCPVPRPAHVVIPNGFDGPRDNLVRLFQPAHGAEIWKRHNNRNGSQQCDGTWPHSSDGRVAFIEIP